MKIHAVVLDLTGNAMDWLNAYGNEEHLELCEILTLDDSSPIPLWDLNKYDNWDILLVFENGVKDKVEQLLEHIGIAKNRIIYPLDSAENSMYEYRSMVSYIFNEPIIRIAEYVSHRKRKEKYAMVSVEGFSYINVATDNVILPEMLKMEKNWAYDDMELFRRLAGEYFAFDKKQDIFCDIGANIGTTCIYFKKKIDRDIRIMAFEPSRENYKLLKINAMLNDIDVSKHMLCNVGLSDKTESTSISYNPVNPGGSSVLDDSSGVKERIDLVLFDNYLIENSVDPEEIKYLWIDVEGYEARFLIGAEKTLEKINVPVFMEFVPRFYADREGEFNLLMNELKKHFKSYIRSDDPNAGKQPIDNLKKEQDNMRLAWDLFLLKE